MSNAFLRATKKVYLVSAYISSGCGNDNVVLGNTRRKTPPKDGHRQI